MYQPLVSIIVPTYNEEKDIAATLDTLINLSYEHKEILVVDDSHDSTPSIVERYSQTGVKLLKQEGSKGRSGARNQGITVAQGEIVIILNADVSLPRDFIERILPHYERGAGYVLVESEISNIEYLFPRYASARGHHRFDNQSWINWTEGFSCLRKAAIDVGLFPQDTPIPICAGEDGVFGKRLEAKYRKIIDRSIVVTHIIPHTLRVFWHQRLGRGKGDPQIAFFVQGRTLSQLYKTLVIRTIVTAGKLILAVHFWKAWRLLVFSPRGIRDIGLFTWACLIDDTAGWVGYLQGVMEIRALGKRCHVAGQY